MDLVRLATHLERRFDVSIPDAEIDVERFGTIARIVAYVETLQSG
jgi:acyl carrier protein